MVHPAGPIRYARIVLKRRDGATTTPREALSYVELDLRARGLHKKL